MDYDTSKDVESSENILTLEEQKILFELAIKLFKHYRSDRVGYVMRTENDSIKLTLQLEESE